MSKFPDREFFTIKCPKCSRKRRETIGWLKKHRGLACTGCGFVLEKEASEILAYAEMLCTHEGPYREYTDAS